MSGVPLEALKRQDCLRHFQELQLRQLLAKRFSCHLLGLI